RYRGGERTSGLCRLGTRSGAELLAVRTVRDFAQDYTRFTSRIPGSFRITRRGRPFDGRNGGNAGLERACRKVAPATRPLTAARTLEPLFQAEEGLQRKGSEK